QRIVDGGHHVALARAILPGDARDAPVRRDGHGAEIQQVLRVQMNDPHSVAPAVSRMLAADGECFASDKALAASNAFDSVTAKRMTVCPRAPRSINASSIGEYFRRSASQPTRNSTSRPMRASSIAITLRR